MTYTPNASQTIDSGNSILDSTDIFTGTTASTNQYVALLLCIKSTANSVPNGIKIMVSSNSTGIPSTLLFQDTYIANSDYMVTIPISFLYYYVIYEGIDPVNVLMFKCVQTPQVTYVSPYKFVEASASSNILLSNNFFVPNTPSTNPINLKYYTSSTGTGNVSIQDSNLGMVSNASSSTFFRTRPSIFYSSGRTYSIQSTFAITTSSPASTNSIGIFNYDGIGTWFYFASNTISISYNFDGNTVTTPQTEWNGDISAINSLSIVTFNTYIIEVTYPIQYIKYYLSCNGIKKLLHSIFFASRLSYIAYILPYCIRNTGYTTLLLSSYTIFGEYTPTIKYSYSSSKLLSTTTEVCMLSLGISNTSISTALQPNELSLSVPDSTQYILRGYIASYAATFTSTLPTDPIGNGSNAVVSINPPDFTTTNLISIFSKNLNGSAILSLYDIFKDVYKAYITTDESTGTNNSDYIILTVERITSTEITMYSSIEWFE